MDVVITALSGFEPANLYYQVIQTQYKCQKIDSTGRSKLMSLTKHREQLLLYLYFNLLLLLRTKIKAKPKRWSHLQPLLIYHMPNPISLPSFAVKVTRFRRKYVFSFSVTHCTETLVFEKKIYKKTKTWYTIKIPSGWTPDGLRLLAY